MLGSNRLPHGGPRPVHPDRGLGSFGWRTMPAWKCSGCGRWCPTTWQWCGCAASSSRSWQGTGSSTGAVAQSSQQNWPSQHVAGHVDLATTVAVTQAVGIPRTQVGAPRDQEAASRHSAPSPDAFGCPDGASAGRRPRPRGVPRAADHGGGTGSLQGPPPTVRLRSTREFAKTVENWLKALTEVAAVQARKHATPQFEMASA